MKSIVYLAVLAISVCCIPQTSAQYVKLHEFDYTNGAYPLGSLIGDSTYLYGVTMYRNNIFRMKYDGTDFESLYYLSNTEGSSPCGTLYSDGLYLYGTSQFNGPNGGGSVFKIRKDGSDFSVVHGLGGNDGEQPTGSVISDGVYLYGMTSGYPAISYGTIFKVKKDGTGFSVLHTFGAPADGKAPRGSLVSDGTYLYGMTRYGGSNDNGTIFRIKPDGSDYVILKTLSTASGAQPWGDLMLEGTYLYGMSSNYGPGGYGTLFKIKTDGTDYTILRSFMLGSSPNGAEPHGSLITDGTYLYGMTRLGGHNYAEGNAFKIKPDGTGYTDMYDFSDAQGNTPVGSLFLKDSSLYGMTYKGGAHQYGVLFKLDLDARVTVGLSELEKQAAIRVFPNPASEVVYIESGMTGGNREYTITNTLGEEIRKGMLDAGQPVSVSSLPGGIYFLKVDQQFVKFIRE